MEKKGSEPRDFSSEFNDVIEQGGVTEADMIDPATVAMMNQVNELDQALVQRDPSEKRRDEILAKVNEAWRGFFGRHADVMSEEFYIVQNEDEEKSAEGSVQKRANGGIYYW